MFGGCQEPARSTIPTPRLSMSKLTSSVEKRARIGCAISMVLAFLPGWDSRYYMIWPPVVFDSFPPMFYIGFLARPNNAVSTRSSCELDLSACYRRVSNDRRLCDRREKWYTNDTGNLLEFMCSAGAGIWRPRLHLPLCQW
ncbi:hypothetical protein I7I48_01948 [Histoplasma ohiense]|nr:hypothetical protein I7I48_01948 [Histoplasma ohiense (nom. inval.)]